MITIGIPNALLFHKYKNLWINFFKELGCEVIISNKSNKKILEEGCKYAQDEACLSLKLYLGHVNSLIGKVDYILVPRLVSIKKREKLCTNFALLYDLIHNTFQTKIIHYNVDIDKGINEKDSFIQMGLELGKSRHESQKAYLKAKQIEKYILNKKIKEQNLALKSQQPKILLVSHSYNLYDNLIGLPIIEYLKENHIQPIYSDIYDNIKTNYESSFISHSIYWTYNKELMGAINHYKKYVDGIILITTFPCGPDSLSNEMITKKVKDIPIISIIIDELNNSSGLITRLESFIDIITMKKGVTHG